MCHISKLKHLSDSTLLCNTKLQSYDSGLPCLLARKTKRRLSAFFLYSFYLFFSAAITAKATLAAA